MLGTHNDLTTAKELEERLRTMATEDALTGLSNRRSFEEHGEWTVANCQRTAETVSVAVIDLDHFKQVNDTHGHQLGDAVLVACSKAIQQGIRKNDFPARWGGEEFIVLLHGAGVAASIEVAERVRSLIAEVGVVEDVVTASIGISTFSGQAPDAGPLFIDQQIRAADRALYAAKESGRDRVVHATSIGAEETPAFGEGVGNRGRLR